jgi:hypothetical protein
MSSIAKVNISLSKKDLTKSRIPPVASRNVVFYHKATLGQLTINLLSLTMPSSEIPTEAQATVSEISGAQLAINKKNLSLSSSSKGKLIQGLDFVVIDSYTISLIGPGYSSGAESDEIFVGTISGAPISDLIVASAKSVFKTYELAVGSTILNLGQEYQVGVNPNDDIGILKVFVNGILARRGVDFDEVDAGSGYGTTLSFKVAPVSIPHQIVVDFGVMSITDNNAIGAIESLAGTIQKIAEDLADVAGTSSTDYFSASPSEVERRAFGDMVLIHEKILDVEVPIETEWVDFASVAAGTLITSTGTSPTYGTVVTNKAQWKRVGSDMLIRWDYRQSSAGTAGTGQYLFNLPAEVGVQIDLTKAPTSLFGSPLATSKNSNVGTFYYGDSANDGIGQIHVYSATQLGVALIYAGAATNRIYWSSTDARFNVTPQYIGMEIRVPIAGWASKQKIRDIIGV